MLKAPQVVFNGEFATRVWGEWLWQRPDPRAGPIRHLAVDCSARAREHEAMGLGSHTRIEKPNRSENVHIRVAHRFASAHAYAHLRRLVAHDVWAKVRKRSHHHGLISNVTLNEPSTCRHLLSPSRTQVIKNETLRTALDYGIRDVAADESSSACD